MISISPWPLALNVPSSDRSVAGLEQGLVGRRLGVEVAPVSLAHPDAQQEDLMRSRALCPAVMIAYATGRYEEAFALAQSSVRIARGCGDLLALGEALHNLGCAATAIGR